LTPFIPEIMQSANTILMVRPAAFGFNRQTAPSNAFQHLPATDEETIRLQARVEFDLLVDALLDRGIQVLVVEDQENPQKPDALFPGDWFCTHPGGEMNVFPMFAANRRTEIRDDILLALARKFKVSNVADWTEYETEGFFLEGTGSMVMDHDHRIIYACLSERTHKILLEKYASLHRYRVISFRATDEAGIPIMHTNLMMCIGDRFAVLCEAAIRDEFERVAVIQLLSTTGHELIPLSLSQVGHFAGNMAALVNARKESFIFLSKQAMNSLTREQVRKLSQFGELVAVGIPTIETYGGGSIRSMMAEIFLPLQNA
jgi:hypothetical protein